MPPSIDEFNRRFDLLLDECERRIKAGMAVDLESICPDDAEMRAALAEELRHAPTSLRAQPAAADPLPPSLPKLADFEIIGLIGVGAMGEVYRARQRRLNRLVALKLLRDLRRPEAEALARLQHPGIVQIFEVGEHEGRPFLVMELVEGGTLAERLSAGAISHRAAAELVQRLSRAVQHAHERGVVHRDLKPSNILLDRAPVVASGNRWEAFVPKIADFGIAKLLDQQGATQTSSIVGTPAYMAPEQLRGDHRRVGPATDIYALGGILRECLIGTPPWIGIDLTERLRPGAEPSWASNSALPPALITICGKCLRWDPARRYATAAELADDLQRWQDGKPILAQPAGKLERLGLWTRRNPSLAAVVVLLAAAVVGSTWAAFSIASARRLAENEALAKGQLAEVNRRQAEKNREDLVRQNLERGFRFMDSGDLYAALPPLVSALELDAGDSEREQSHRDRLGMVWALCPRLVQVWAHRGPVHFVELHPTQSRAVSASRDGTARVWDYRTGAAVGPPIDDALPEGSEHPSWVWHATLSPDAKRVAAAFENGVGRVWDLESGRPMGRALRHQERIGKIRFSPDGRWVATASRDRTARVWDAATGEPVTPHLLHEGPVRDLQFHPTRHWLLTACDDRQARIWEIDSEVTEPLRRFRHAGVVEYAEFSPDGGRVLTTSWDATARVWDLEGNAIGRPMKHAYGIPHGAFSADGRRIATASADGTARVWDAESGEAISPPVIMNSGS